MITKSLLGEYNWAKKLAQDTIGEECELSVRRDESVPPGEVGIWMYDLKTGGVERKVVRTENYDLNNEADKEERVKQWALEAKAKLDWKRDPSGY